MISIRAQKEPIPVVLSLKYNAVEKESLVIDQVYIFYLTLSDY